MNRSNKLYRLLFGFVVLLSCFYGCSRTPDFDKDLTLFDSSVVIRICDKIKLAPEQKDVDSLSSQLDIRVSNPNSIIEVTLQQLLDSSRTRLLVLHSLSIYQVPNFDFSLARMTINIDSLGDNDSKNWLAAVSSSGGNMCFDKIASFIQAPFSHFNKDNCRNRAKLYEVLAKINYLNSCKQALLFYGSFGELELDSLTDDENPVISLLENLQNRRANIPELYEFLQYFVHWKLKDPSVPPAADSIFISKLKNKLNAEPNVKKTIEYIVRTMAETDTQYGYLFVNTMGKIPFYDTLRSKYIPVFTFKSKYPSLIPGDKMFATILSKTPEDLKPYKTIFHKIMGDIESSYRLLDADTLSWTSNFVDTFISSRPYLKIVEKELAFDVLWEMLCEGTTNILIEQTKDVLTNPGMTAQAIVDKEYDIITMALYGLAKVHDRSHVKYIFKLENYDRQMFNESGLENLVGIPNTILKRNLLSDYTPKSTSKDSSTFYDDVLPTLGFNKSATKFDTVASLSNYLIRLSTTRLQKSIRTEIPYSRHKIVRVDVLNRKISFIQNLYEEELKLTYENNDTENLVWLGLIPQKYLLAIQRFPRILDFMEISLAQEEWKNLAWRNYNYKTDWDAVSMNPNYSIPFLTSNLLQPELPLSYFVDEIRLSNTFFISNRPYFGEQLPYMGGYQKPSSISSIFLEKIRQSALVNVPLVKPKPEVAFKPWAATMDSSTLSFLRSGYPATFNFFYGNFFCARATQYDSIRKQLVIPINYLVCYHVVENSYRQIRSYVEENQPDWVGEVPILSWLAPQIFGNLNKQKIKNLDACDRNISCAVNSQDFMSDWDVMNLSVDLNVKVIMRQTVIDSSLSKFIGTYQLNFPNGQVKFISLEGSLGSIPDDIKKYIRDNSGLLTVANADLTGSTVSGSDYFQRLYLTHYNDVYGQFSTQNMLKLSGNLWNRPITQAETPTDILKNSPNGIILASEMKFLQRLWDIGRFGSNIYDDAISPGFADAINKLSIQLNSDIVENSNRLAAESIADIKSKNEKEREISFSVSFGGDKTSYSVRYKNSNVSVGLGVFNEANGNTSLFGKLNDMPVFNFQMPRQDVNENKLGQYNSTVNNELNVLEGSVTPFNDNLNYDQNISRNIASVEGQTTISKTNWNMNADGSYEYTGPVVYTSSPPWKPLDESILGPYDVTVDLMSKYDIREAEIITLLKEALPVLDEKTIQLYLKGLTTKQFTPEMMNDLIAARNKGYEQNMIQSGEWAQTEYTESLVPDKTYPGEIDRVQTYLDETNKKETAKFSAKIDEKRAKLKTESVVDKRLSYKIIFDKKLDFMRLELVFQFKDGDKATLGSTQEVPWFIDKKRILNDPSGHVFEKILNSLVEPKWGTASSSGLEPGEKATIDKILNTLLKPQAEEAKKWSEEKKKYIESLTVGDTLTNIERQFFQRLEKWCFDKDNQGQYTKEVFAVSPIEYAFLQFYPFHLEVSETRERLINRIQLFQKSSPLAQSFRSGTNQVNQ